MADLTKRMPGGAPATKRMPENFVATPALSLRPGEFIDDQRYEIIQALSDRGGEAEVYLCRDHGENGREVVVKLYHSNFKPKHDILAKLKGSKHPDIIAIFDFGEWNGRFYEVMEYARGGPVYQAGKTMTEEQLIKIVREIDNALHFCHSKDIIHRDLKPTNLFYRDSDKTDVVLGDFGISSLMTADEEIHKTTGHRTSEYAAPEQFENLVVSKTDYYALGMTILTLLKGSSPLSGYTEPAMLQAHMFRKIPIPTDCSPRLQQLLRGLLTKEIEDRWGHEQVSRWLNGEEVEVRESKAVRHLSSFLLGPGVEANSLTELAQKLQENWQHGLETLGRDAERLCNWVAEENRQIAEKIQDAINDRKISKDERLLKVICWLDPERPYLLLPGYRAETPQQLAQQIYTNEHTWQAGRQQLFNGLIPTWLCYSRFGEYARPWEEHKAEFKERQDEGLDFLLRLLDPNLPSPALQVSPAKLDFGKLAAGGEKALTLTLANPGAGYLFGKIKTEGAPAGFRLSQESFNGNQVSLTATLQVDRTVAPEKYEFTLHVNFNGGMSRLLVCKYRVVSAAAARAGGGLAKVGRALVSKPVRQTALAMVFGALLGMALRFALMLNNPTIWQRRTVNFTGQSWPEIWDRGLELGRYAPIHYAAFFLFALFLLGWARRRAAQK